jgi:hypothetical protein
MNARVSTALAAATIGLAALAMPGICQAANVGYYEMCTGTGGTGHAAAITAAGHTPVNVDIPNAATLSTLDALFVTNCDNDGYGGEYLANLGAIDNAVQTQGLVLVVHDRHVSGASTILPGVVGVRDFANGANIDLPVGSPLLSGPGGTLNNGSLDGWGSSNHGYVVAATLPAGGAVLANNSVPEQAVTMVYPRGTGKVVYSTIPLDLWVQYDGAFRDVYTPNLLAWVVPNFVSCAAEGFSGSKLTLCRQICEIDQTPTKLTSLIKLYMSAYRSEPPCGR